MEQLLQNIKQCRICDAHLPLGPRPVVSAHPDAKIVIIGQAPGTKVHASGIPWDDPSGNQLRKWLNVSVEDFYDATKFAIIPMGFCYPGKGKSGDLPPRKECAPEWHELLFDELKQVELILLIGAYAQKYYLGKLAKKTLTETVKNYNDYLPRFLPLPHPSPRNRFWLIKNKWFEVEVLPTLQARIKKLI
ncbi:uracil-DNA glycosylase family protein [Pseudotamlana carrageenivorans]|uniref:IclR family transcriptional regulator n=1 Tax=Pseudotamlana carrageenivorans TaxID=2069432 RepID=A0A2I7SHB2_9FLAO|nr:uracil-DNA glycosylase family protein [Tamlana carrageenivorans]AUS05292.1 IclR family transcriptional regulator [Tamlana carrageenivorans]